MTAITAGVKRTFREMNGTSLPTVASIPHKSSSSTTPGTNRSSRSASSSKSPEIETGSGPVHQSFGSDASLVLIGVRGSGRSSLGFLASAAYSRRLIEVENVFTEVTGTSPMAFRKMNGSAAFHQKHHEVFKLVLEGNRKNSIIICSFSDLERTGARLLREYAKSHPVIHITRDSKGIQSHVQTWSEDKIVELLRVSKPLLRACSNFEFYNISEDMERTSPNSDHSGQPLTRLAKGPFLTLKRAEHDFLRLLRNILGDNTRHSSHHSVYPLSQVRLEDMEFPSVVRISVADIMDNKLDLDDAQIGVDAVELEIEMGRNGESMPRQMFLDRISQAFAIMRRTTILPIILFGHLLPQPATTCATEAEVIEHCLRLGPEYCRINMSSQDTVLELWVAKAGMTRLIGSHSFRLRPHLGWQDPQCISVYERACRIGFRFIDIVMPADGTEDSFDALSFARTVRSTKLRDTPTVSVHCTGKLGRASMCLGACLIPVRAQLQAEKSNLAITSKQRNRSLFASSIYFPLNFFIYGENVGFSLSPTMHNAAYKACGMSHTYGTHSASSLDDLARLVRQDDFGGAAIVQPFKTTALLLMDQLSPQAKVIGAVNTVIPIREEARHSHAIGTKILPGRNRSGPVKALCGDNTDWIGIRACVRRSLSPANTIRPQSTALVCGAGGMARAGIFALISLGVKNIFVCNRTRNHAEALAQHYNNLVKTNSIAEASSVETGDVRIEALPSFESPWPENTRHPTMIVSCIPTLTSDGTATNFTIPPSWLLSPTGGVVTELAYMPAVTPVVLQLGELAHKGWILQDGLDVLPEQAFAQFELFTGKRAPRKLMRDEIFKHYNEDSVPMQGALNTDSPAHS